MLCWNFKRAVYKTWPLSKLIEARKTDPNRKAEIHEKRGKYVDAKKTEDGVAIPKVYMGKEAQVAFVQKKETVLLHPRTMRRCIAFCFSFEMRSFVKYNGNDNSISNTSNTTPSGAHQRCVLLGAGEGLRRAVPEAPHRRWLHSCGRGPWQRHGARG